MSTEPVAQLRALPDGGYEVAYRVRRFRFLLDNGQTVDVEAIGDDSKIRGLLTAGGRTIAGVAELEEALPRWYTPEPPS